MATHLCSQCGFDIVHKPTQGNRSRLRSRLSELDSLIAALTAERDALGEQSDAIVYPVLSLPAEVTAEIFQSCVSVSSSLDIGAPIVVPQPSLAPLLLLRICRRWREIALSTPRLWRSLQITEAVPTEVIDAWFARAGDLALEYRLYRGNAPDAVLDSLLKNSILDASCWEDVAFRIPPRLGPEIDLRDQTFPHLRKFSLNTYQFATDVSVVTTSLSIAGAPLLREVDLCHIPPAVHLDIPWTQLTYLKLYGMETALCLSIVAACSQLQRLNALTEGVAVSRPFLTLPHLHSITSTLAESSLLQYLILELLEALASRSNFPLEDFTVYSGPNTLEHFRVCLHALPPSVTRLSLVWSCEIDLRDMLMLLRNVELFPRLQQLVVRYGGLVSRNRYRALVDLLHARAAVLEQVELSLTPMRMASYEEKTPGTAVLDHIDALVAGGMKIRIEIFGIQRGTDIFYDSTR